MLRLYACTRTRRVNQPKILSDISGQHGISIFFPLPPLTLLDNTNLLRHVGWARGFVGGVNGDGQSVPGVVVEELRVGGGGVGEHEVGEVMV